MSGLGDVRSKKVKKLLVWLSTNSDIMISAGGRHQTKVTIIHTGESYPLPLSHKIINKHLVEKFRNWLVTRQVCSDQDFNDRIK